MRGRLGDWRAFALAGLLCAACAVLGGPEADAAPAPPLHITGRILERRPVEGTALVVAYSMDTATRERGRWVWEPYPDDGRVFVEAHTPRGWAYAPTRPGGEGRARVLELPPRCDAVRVVHDGRPAVVSSPIPL